jgi:2-(1,2-epoxy-1,2-dihydrophenyl)acetyl-CoA isomerase
MSNKTVELKIIDGVAWVTLNRSEAANTINTQMADELFAALEEAAECAGAKCIVLTANGALFCAGGDISDLGADPEKIPENIGALAASFHRSILAIDRLEKPFVTSIQGTAAGAGLVLAAMGDIALASERAKFQPAYSTVGLSPDGGSTWTLPRLIGTRRAMEMMLTGEGLNAVEAAEAGLITRVVKHEHLRAETTTLAAKLAGGPARALGCTRKLVRSGWHVSLDTHLQAEALSIAETAGQDFARTAIKAFLNKH